MACQCQAQVLDVSRNARAASTRTQKTRSRTKANESHGLLGYYGCAGSEPVCRAFLVGATDVFITELVIAQPPTLQKSHGFQVSGLCPACSLKHRNVLSKTQDQAIVTWFVNLATEDEEEYRKILAQSVPDHGAKRSKFSLTQYREESLQRKTRGEREGQILMDFTRYLKYHTEEIFPLSDRMTPSEVKTAWLRDVQGSDFERRQEFSKKTGKMETRDYVWQKVGQTERYKLKEEESSIRLGRIAEGNGSDHALTVAQKRFEGAKFVAKPIVGHLVWARAQPNVFRMVGQG